MPNPQIVDAAGVYGYAATATDKIVAATEAVAQTVIAAKTLVALSTTEAQVVPAATNQNVASVIGVALNAAITGQPVAVATEGMIFGVVKDTSTGQNIAQFDRVQISTNTAGQAALLSSATAITQQKDIGLVVGVAMAAATTGIATVDLFLSRW